MSLEAFSAVVPELAVALTRRGFTALTPIQAAVVEPGLAGRDLRISSRTGSGKTVALGLVLGAALGPQTERRPPGRAMPRTLLIAPTRELAAQIGRELTWLFADLKLSVCVVTGGTSVGLERRALSANPTVLVGTPGRLCDHLDSGALDLGAVEAVVLDEADQMLELGFREAIEMLLGGLPSDCQRHLVSATFPRAVEALALRYQRKPYLVQGSAPDEAHSDITYVAHLVRDDERYPALVNLLLMSPEERTLVFVRTRVDATDVATRLANDGFRAAALSGELAQAERTRTLEAFRRGAISVLVCTDVASRGIDIPNIPQVIHGDLPDGPESLTHRSGRTGRAGNKGASILLVPAQRRAFAEMLLRGARVRARFCPAPSPEQVRRAAEQRVFEQLGTVVQEPANEAMATLAARLIEAHGAESVVKALLARMGVHGSVAPHELSVVTERLKRLPPREAPERKWKKARPQHHAAGQHHAGAGGRRFPARRAR
jgi:ATP-dependent RNA helicase DeaD